MKRDPFPLIFGVLASTVLAGTLVIAGLKAGITPGVSPLVILFAWGAFTRRLAAGGGSHFLNIAQVAGSAGMAVTAGVIFTAPVIQILHANLGLEVPPVDVWNLILLSIAGSFMGFGFVGLATGRFLSDPTLPAPEARACEVMIDTAIARPDARPRLGRSLYAGLCLSFLAPLLVHIGLAREKILLAKVPSDDPGRVFKLELPFTPIYLGIGGLLTLATALLVFCGSFLRLVGDWALTGVNPTGASALDFPTTSMRWVGGGAMTVAVAYSLLKFRSRGTEQASAAGEAGERDSSLLQVDEGMRKSLCASIAAGVLLLLGWLLFAEGATLFSFSMGATVLLMCSLMVVLGALLSLQIGSSASPVSGTVFVTTLVLCLVSLAISRNQIQDVSLLVPLIVGACVAVCTANDSSQDYKTMQLCGVRVQEGFLAQILGLLGGCLVVPLVLYVAHSAYTLGSDDLPAPQGQMFATLIQGLLLDRELPWYPILIGLAVGAGAVAMEMWGDRKRIPLPSMALAVGIYLPAYIGIGILIGASCRWIAERGAKRQRGESILASAGLITGAAALDLLLGIAILCGFKLSGLELFTTASESELMSVPGWLPGVFAAAGIASLGGLIWINSKAQDRSQSSR